MTNNNTNSDKYKPTAVEEKLIEVLLNPNCLGKSITEICEMAGVSRKSYYVSIKKDGFNN